MMQVVVWVVCAAGVALAAGLVHWKTARMRIELMPPQTIGGLAIRLPRGWMMKVEAQAGIHIIRCVEQVPDGGPARALVVLRESVTEESDPLDFLIKRVLRDDGSDDADPDTAEPISVDGHKGVVLEYAHRTLVGRAIHTERRTCACIMLDGGNVVVVQYLGQGDPNGKNLVREIVQSIQVVDDVESRPARVPRPRGGAV